MSDSVEVEVEIEVEVVVWRSLCISWLQRPLFPALNNYSERDDWMATLISTPHLTPPPVCLPPCCPWGVTEDDGECLGKMGSSWGGWELAEEYRGVAGGDGE